MVISYQRKGNNVWFISLLASAPWGCDWMEKVVKCQQEMSSGLTGASSQYYSRATQQSIWETQRIIANCEYCQQAGKVSILSMRCAGVF